MSLNSGRYTIKNTVNEDFLEIIGPKQAWFLGLMASDGNVRNDRSFSISQSNSWGLETIEYIRQLIGFSGPTYTNKNAFSITVTSPRLVSRLRMFNIVARKTLVYTYPRLLDNSLVVFFLQGYVEGDGSVGIYRNNKGCYHPIISFVGTKEFIYSLILLLPIKPNVREIKSAQNLYEIRYNGRKALSFGEWLWGEEVAFPSRKKVILDQFLAQHQPEYIKYSKLKLEALELWNMGIGCMQIAESLGLPFQTIYAWRKEWSKQA